MQKKEGCANILKFEQKFMVGIREIDYKNELTNYGFIAFFQDIASKHSESLNVGIKDINICKHVWILSDWNLEVLKRPHFGEEVLVKTYATEMKKASYFVYRCFEVYNCDNELIATAVSKWIWYDIENNKISKVDLEFISRFEMEENTEYLESRIKKLKETDSFLNEYDYTIKRFDLDINNHMNNLNYVKLAYEALPEDVYFNKTFDNLNVTYKNQIKLGDKVKCFYSIIENKYIITIKSIDEKILHSIVELW